MIVPTAYTALCPIVLAQATCPPTFTGKVRQDNIATYRLHPGIDMYVSSP